jgi:hypothetical protein
MPFPHSGFPRLSSEYLPGTPQYKTALVIEKLIYLLCKKVMHTSTIKIFISILLCLPILANSQVLESDSLALVAFYNENGGEFWFNDDNWLDGPVSTWYGITVENNRVTEIGFYDNGVMGSFPVSLTELDSLREIELGKNSLTGSLPDEIGNLTALVYFSVRTNSLSGEIPPTIGNCKSLESLNISVNDFEGTFPETLSGLNNLTRITAHKNQLSGQFPEVLLDMPWLTYLLLETNNFTGQIPAEIDSLQNLTTLNLSSCQFSGPMPKIHHLTQLSALHLGDMELEGDLDTILGYHPNLYYFTPQLNKFTGRISTGHFNPDRLELVHFNNNNFTEIDDWFAFADTGVLMRFYVHGNLLDFDDLEPNAHLPVSNFRYYGQEKLGDRDTVILEIGGSYTMHSPMQSNAVIYQWYFNGDTIPGATGENFTVTDFDNSKAGMYHFDARHPDFPDLTLERHPIVVQSETVSINEIDQASWSVYPNPASQDLTISLMDGNHEATIDMFDVQGDLIFSHKIDSKETLDIQNLAPGIYALQLRTASGQGYKKLIITP